MTPRTPRPAARTRSARRPASAGSQPHRGRPTLTSITTSRTPPATAASTVASESTAAVTRAVPASTTAPRRRQSSTSLASSRSSPSPAAAMPSTSRIVAQVNVRWPAAASSAARAVDLNALTWGRSFGPGRAAASVATLWSKAPRSTIRAGVGTSVSCTLGDVIDIGSYGRWPRGEHTCGRQARCLHEPAPSAVLGSGRADSTEGPGVSHTRWVSEHGRSFRIGIAVVAGFLGLGAVAGPAGAQVVPAPLPTSGPLAPAPLPPGGHAPPADNVFPVPAPYQVDFTDSWHACRSGCSRRHEGNDLLTAKGNPEVAVEAGVIIKVQNQDVGLGGLSIWLKGDSGVSYYYAHNSANLVTVGQRVTRGQLIGKVGRTGDAAGGPTHIHFQINTCGQITSDEPCTVDPFAYLKSWSQNLLSGGADGVGWYEPRNATWGMRTDMGSNLSPATFGPKGAPNVLPVAGDWNGDGQDSIGLYVRSDATFHLRDDHGRDLPVVHFGTPGRMDVWPIAGDFDGDGKDTVGLYSQADATFTILVDGGVRSAPLAVGVRGRTDALPVVGDWNGDGKDSVGVYQQADGTLTLLDDKGHTIDPATEPKLNARPPGESPFDAFPVAGDWDGTGRDTVGLMWRVPGQFDLPVPNLLDPKATRTVTAARSADALPVAGDWNGRNVVTLDELH